MLICWSFDKHDRLENVRVIEGVDIGTIFYVGERCAGAQALPHGLGYLLLGSLWQPAYTLVIPFVLSIMGAGFQVGAAAGLHALGAARRSLRAMIITSAISLAFSLVGAGLIALLSLPGALVWSSRMGRLGEARE